MVRLVNQKQWIEGRGLFIACAFFLGGIGGGLYLVSAFFNDLTGMFVSWVLALMMGVCYMIHLTKPLRAWRVITRPQTSWISRGFTFISLFIVLGFVQLCFSYWLPGSAAAVVFKVLAGIAAFAQAIYTGFVLSYVNAIKFWNSALVPVLFVICGLLGGTGILLAISLGNAGADVGTVENITRILLIAYAIIIVVYLWNSTYTDQTARRSVSRLLKGPNAPVFWVGVVALGVVIPLAISLYTYFGGTIEAALLFAAIGCEIIGGFSLRYCILKLGIYSPVIPRPA